jgi:RNA polymerase sigma-70 factor (ECF subfamily)
MEELGPDRSQQATLRSMGDQELQEIVARYVDAWANNDVNALVGLLTENATLTMPPIPSWYRGREAIAVVFSSMVFDGTLSWRMVPIAANGQLALGAYRLDSSGVYTAHGVTVLTLRDGLIDQMAHFRTASLVEQFGLPARA